MRPRCYVRFGSVFVLLVFDLLPHTPKVNLAIIWNQIKTFYVENKTKHRYKSINKLTMFKKKAGYAKMRGKAVEIMGLGPALLKVWTKYMNKTLQEHRIIRLCLSLCVRMEEILNKYLPCDGFLALPQQAAEELVTTAFSLVQLNVQLCEFYADVGKKLFTVTSKCHYLLHICLQADAIHPRLCWCFSGEDYMKCMQRLVRACCNGRVKPELAMKAVAEHYRLGLWFTASRQSFS